MEKSKLTLKKLCKEAHKTAKEKGFWDTERNKGELLMLCVSELGEALEALRKDRRQGEKIKTSTECKNCGGAGYIFYSNYDKFIGCNVCNGSTEQEPYEIDLWQKDTFEDEIADTFIRLADLCEAMNIDIEWQIKKKMAYNKTRERLHGKQF